MHYIALTEDSLSLKVSSNRFKTRLFKGATAQFNESSELIEFADGGEVYENNFYLRAESGSVNDATDEFAKWIFIFALAISCEF